MTKTQEAFFAFLRVGLWEDVARVNVFRLEVNDNAQVINYEEVLSLAQKQSVVGLVSAGIEVSKCSVPLTEKLKFVGLCVQIEQRNNETNCFINRMVKQMQENEIEALLVKGQGIAQCYTRPLWRISGDVDFFFKKEDYERAKALLLPKASDLVQEAKYTKSCGLTIGEWFVEVHGTLRNSLSTRLAKEIDAVQKDTFDNLRFRIWKNGETDVFLPEVNNDLFFVFTHFVRHFYKEGCVVRQLCDWCRLMWTYHNEIDSQLLETRLKRAGLLDEWKSFAALAVDNLAMPKEAMPLYEEDERWQRKGEKILNFILKDRKPNKVKDTFAIAKIFPQNTFLFLPGILFHLNWLKIKEHLFYNIRNQ